MIYLDKDTQERTMQRKNHLEDPNYKRLSDVISSWTYYYDACRETDMVAQYLGGKKFMDFEAIGQLIEENMHNPTINWNGLYSYLDERIKTTPTATEEIMRIECRMLKTVLEPYRKRFRSTFVGF